MIFNSWEFASLFVLVFGIFYAIAPQLRKWVLLAASFVFIGFNHWGYLILAISTAFLTYGSGILVDKQKEDKQRQCVFTLSLVAHLLILIFFKYFGFLEANLGTLINVLGFKWNPTITKVFLPLGISFYIFQSISYLIEVYWEEQEAETNLQDFMLYMLFFMKFLSGPIERPGDFLPQIKEKKKFDYDNVNYGLKLIAIGLFKKLIIANHLAGALNDVFASVQDFSGAQLLVATLIYPIQLYADFSGYTDIAIGGAAVLGYKLSPNFNRPFIAQTITDFWRRWHMSLSFWVKDYIYEPLAFKKRNWGIWGISYALIITFILLGLWHGDSWNFIIYGAIQGSVIIYEISRSSWCAKWNKYLSGKWFKTYSIIRTYVIFAVSLLFFKVEKLTDVLYVFRHLFDGIRATYKEINFGMTDHNVIVLTCAIVLVFIYEYADSKWDIWGKFEQKPIAVRWSVYYLLIFIIFSCGDFGATDFIYLQF